MSRYDPFQFDRLPVRTFTCTWEVVEQADAADALRTLARFRKKHPSLMAPKAADLEWGFAWTEKAVLLDLSLDAGERAEKREEAVQTVAMFCKRDAKVVYGDYRNAVPEPLFDFILEEEIARRSQSDWAYG